MFVKRIRYSDLDGNPREEEFYFHLGKARLIELQVSKAGLEEKLRRIVRELDGPAIMAQFEEIMKMSYGRKSIDGRRFEQSEEMWLDFKQCPAYGELLEELMSGGTFAADFIKAIMPTDVAAGVDFEAAEKSFLAEAGMTSQEQTTQNDLPAWIREDRDPTKHEMAGMTRPQLADAMRRKQARDVRNAQEEFPEPLWLIERRQASIAELEEMSAREFKLYQQHLPSLP